MNSHHTTHVPLVQETAPKLAVVDWVALILMTVGAINWGLVGAFGFDLVAFLLGPMTLASRAIYVLVGLAGLYGVAMPIRLRQRH